MKKINNYIQEKLIINKNIKPNSIFFNKVFEDINQLLEEINNFYEGKINPNIITNNLIPMSCMIKGRKYTNIVYDHFYVQFKNNDDGLCFGVLETTPNKSLIIQKIKYHTTAQKSKGIYILPIHTYKFGKDNFLDWYNNLPKVYNPIKKIFNIKPE